MMMNEFKVSLVALVAGVIAIMSGEGAFAQADRPQEQNPVAQEAAGLTEVTVTARRVEENIQRVPILITAFDEQSLAKVDARNIQGIMGQVGGLDICCGPGNVGFVFMRGLQGVVSYFADAPKTAEGNAGFFDTQSYQVLKGPQGTLFGLASNAGAIVVEPKKPGETLGGEFATSAGNFGRRSFRQALYSCSFLSSARCFQPR